MAPPILVDGEETTAIFAYIRKCDNSKGDISLRLSDPGLFVYEILDERCLKYMLNSDGEGKGQQETSPTSDEQDIGSDSDADMDWNSDEEPSLASEILEMSSVMYSYGQRSDVVFTRQTEANSAMLHQMAPPRAAVRITDPRTARSQTIAKGTFYYDGVVYHDDPADTAPEIRGEDAAEEAHPFQFTKHWSEVKQLTMPKPENHKQTYELSAVALQDQAREAVSLALRSQNARPNTDRRVETAIAKPIQVELTSGSGENVEASARILEKKRMMAWFSGENRTGLAPVVSPNEGRDTAVDALSNAPEFPCTVVVGPEIRHPESHIEPLVAEISSRELSFSEEAAEIERVLGEVRRRDAEFERVLDEVRRATRRTRGISPSETPSSLEAAITTVCRNGSDFRGCDHLSNVLVDKRPCSTAPNAPSGIARSRGDAKPLTTSSSGQNLPQRPPHVPYPVRAEKPTILPPVTSFDHVLRSIAALRIGGVTPNDREGWIKPDGKEAETGEGGTDKTKGSAKGDNAGSRTPSTSAEGRGRLTSTKTPLATCRRPLGHQPSSPFPTRPGEKSGPRPVPEHPPNIDTRGGRRKKRLATAQNPSSQTAGRDAGRGRGLSMNTKGTGQTLPPSGRGGGRGGSVSPSGRGVVLPGRPQQAKARDQGPGHGTNGRSPGRGIPKAEQAPPTTDPPRPSLVPTGQIKSAGYRRYYVAVPASWEIAESST
ncbi:hypothetical protein FRB96_008813 [Tulasnella sp. 330]|nr:hypothetical protein FRB96_008813 [Tulasnella sp. 330]